MGGKRSLIRKAHKAIFPVVDERRDEGPAVFPFEANAGDRAALLGSADYVARKVGSFGRRGFVEQYSLVLSRELDSLRSRHAFAFVWGDRRTGPLRKCEDGERQLFRGH